MKKTKGPWASAWVVLLAILIMVSLSSFAGGKSSTSSVEPKPSETPETTVSEVKETKAEPVEEFYQVEGDIKPFEVGLGKKITGEPSVQVVLNGSRKEKLRLGSGATGVVVTQNVVKSLGLKVIRKAEVTGKQRGAYKIDIVLIKTLEIGGLKITNVPAAVESGSPRPGSVGLTLIGRFGFVELDFKKRKLRFSPYDEVPKAKEPAKGESRVPFFESLSGEIIVEAWLNDHPCKASVATGTTYTYVSRSFLKRIGVGVRRPGKNRDFRGRLWGFGGSTSRAWIIGSRVKLRIGDKELPVRRVRRDVFSGGALAIDMTPGRDIILGMSHLK
ncbi:MAG: aspartyl protease family protein, partial [Candidatus Binatia bacterium]